jgi:hypothetical protein
MCEFCGYGNHTTDTCRLKKTIDDRRRESGLSTLATIAGTTTDSTGPAMTTDSFIIGNALITVLVNSGATSSFIHESAICKLKQMKRGSRLSVIYLGGNGQPAHHDGTVTTTVLVHKDLQPFSQTFLISNTIPFEVILCTDGQSKCGLMTDPANKRLLLPGGRTVRTAPIQTCVVMLPEQDQAIASDERDTNFVSQEDLTADINPSDEPTSHITVNEHLSIEQTASLENLLEIYKSVFAPASGLEPCHFPPMRINTGDAAPIFQQPFRIPFSERDAIRKHVQLYLERG